METTQLDLVRALLVIVRDLVDDFDALPKQQRADVVTAAANFVADLRAAGVHR